MQNNHVLKEQLFFFWGGGESTTFKIKSIIVEIKSNFTAELQVYLSFTTKPWWFRTL